MSDFDTEIEDLRACGVAASDAAGQVQALNPGPGLEQAGDAMPGSASAALLTAASQRWSQWATTMDADLDGYAAQLTGAADAYAASDDEARRALDTAYAPVPPHHR